MMLTLLFLTKPAARRLAGSRTDLAIRIFLVAGAVGTGLYQLSRWQEIAMSGGETLPLDAWVDDVRLLKGAL